MGKRLDRRRILPGFPWEGSFQTKEEVDAYFANKKIQCLLCGKWYRRITPMHLTWKHNMSIDAYRERYGLPWTRGLSGQLCYKKLSRNAKRQLKEGRVMPINKRGRTPRKPQRPLPAFVREVKRKQMKAMGGRPVLWQREDYEAILERIRQQQRTLIDVCKDPDLPGKTSWERFVKIHPEFAEKVRQIYASWPYARQVKLCQKLSPQFRIDCQRLHAQGMNIGRVARVLGVGRGVVSRALRSTNEEG